MNYKYKVLGVNRIDFNTPEGEHINGVRLWVCAPTADPAWLNGVEVFKLWFPFGSPMFDQVCNLKFAVEITGECDRKGRPLNISVVA